MEIDQKMEQNIDKKVRKINRKLPKIQLKSDPDSLNIGKNELKGDKLIKNEVNKSEMD